jgi:hypothetical protein
LEVFVRRPPELAASSDAAGIRKPSQGADVDVTVELAKFGRPCLLNHTGHLAH